jgi:hypothetical protein
LRRTAYTKREVSNGSKLSVLAKLDGGQNHSLRPETLEKNQTWGKGDEEGKLGFLGGMYMRKF